MKTLPRALFCEHVGSLGESYLIHKDHMYLREGFAKGRYGAGRHSLIRYRQLNAHLGTRRSALSRA